MDEQIQKLRDSDVADAIRSVFTLSSPIYIPWGVKNTPYEADEFPNIQMLPEDSGDTSLSEFGTQVFGSVSFEAGEYMVYGRTGAIEKIKMDLYTLPSSCIVEFARSTNMPTTEVLGSTGTVKEIYGKGDWDITIRGIAIGSRNGMGPTAHEQIAQLVKWDNICDSIPVLGSIFREKGINNIANAKISIQPIVGRWNAIPFQIDAVSDEPIELYLI